MLFCKDKQIQPKRKEKKKRTARRSDASKGDGRDQCLLGAVVDNAGQHSVDFMDEERRVVEEEEG